MGKFDGILLLSDWDGTLAYSRESGTISDPIVPEENIRALQYFQENGGVFAVCSGRPCRFFDRYRGVVSPDYIIGFGGALTVKFDTAAVLYSGFAGVEAFDFIDDALALVGDGLIRSIVTYDNDGLTDYTVEEYRAAKEELRGRSFYKWAFRPYTAEGGDEIMRIMRKSENPLFLFVRSWAFGLEIIRRECSKGAALLRLKERVGAKIAIAVGDNDNDLDMLEAADISYAVGDGNPALQALADHITSGVRDGAIASLICDIEKTLDL